MQVVLIKTVMHICIYKEKIGSTNKALLNTSKYWTKLLCQRIDLLHIAVCSCYCASIKFILNR